MSERKPSAMMIDETGGNNFTPDPLLDLDRQYDGRIIGFAHIGDMEKDVMNDQGPTGEKTIIKQCIIAIELTEEDTRLVRGEEGSETYTNRIFYKWDKYSSHVKSNLYKIAGHASKTATWEEGGEGRIDPVEMLGQPIAISLKNNKDNTKQNIKETSAIQAKYHAGVEPAESPLFMFGVNTGACAGTSIADVPPWILAKSLSDAVNATEFKFLEEMEEQAALNAAAKEEAKSGKLEGDDAPKKTTKAKSKAKGKKVEKEDEKEEAEPEAPAKPEKTTADEKAPARRQRKSSKKDSVDYSDKSIEEMEAILVSKEVDDEEIDALMDANEDDDDYLKALVARANQA